MPPSSPSDPCQRNDDRSGNLMLNGWNFDFYGTNWNSIFVNNNGNVSFGQAFSTFSASGFPVNGFPMVAPFWADVDTRGVTNGAGTVWYRQWSLQGGQSVNRLVVTWDHVGYFSGQTDKLNTFQVILTDGNDPLIGLGNNVCFCYDDMQWTTGSASGGQNGFGGTPATVGANLGDGVTFFQVGRFDHAGTDYDGPGGNPDGVSFLDNAQFCFSTTSAGTNTAPIFLTPVTTHNVILGQVLNFGAEAIGPETGETVTLTADLSQLLASSVTSMLTPGNPAIATFVYRPTATSELGPHTVALTATDNGTPQRMTTINIVITVDQGGIDLTPPVTTLTNRIARIEAVSRDTGGANTGLASITLGANSTNLVLYVPPFAQGAPQVTWAVGRLDSLQPGSGTVEVADRAMNMATETISLAPAGDCNGNGIPDAMDIANFTSFDWNGNGIPDECEQLGVVYCSPQLHNSTGLPSGLIVSGSNRVADNAVVLTALNVPPSSFGTFLVSPTQGFLNGPASGFSSGNLCLSQQALGIYRQQITVSSAAGVMSIPINLNTVPLVTGPTVILPGTTLNFQGFYRDNNATIRSNLTDAVQVTFY